MPVDFNEREKRIVIANGLDLIKDGYVTGFNYLNSEKPLPDNALLIHYLHDSQIQIDYVKKEGGFSDDDFRQVRRFTYYMLDPNWMKKPEFASEYSAAKFFDLFGNLKSLDDALKNPFDTFIESTEWDVIVPVSNADVSSVAQRIYDAERKGPLKWMTPAIIARGVEVPELSGFSRAHYASLARQNSEFYSLVVGNLRKSKLRRKLKTVCADLKNEANVDLKKNSVLWLAGEINSEFGRYLTGQA